MAKLNAKDVQITLEDGRVLHFLVSAGDKIYCNEVHTYTGDKPTDTNRNHYFILTLTPCESTEG